MNATGRFLGLPFATALHLSAAKPAGYVGIGAGSWCRNDPPPPSASIYYNFRDGRFPASSWRSTLDCNLTTPHA